MKTLKCCCSKDILVDDEDYEKVKDRVWSHAGNNLYSKRFTPNLPITVFTFAAPPEGYVVDHIDRDPHNNQRYNLRFATRSQNAMNQGIRSTNTSGYKGVRFHRTTKKWRASIMVNYKAISLGLYHTPEEAALVWNKAALKYHGDFAFQNLVPTQSKQ